MDIPKYSSDKEIKEAHEAENPELPKVLDLADVFKAHMDAQKMLLEVILALYNAQEKLSK